MAVFLSLAFPFILTPGFFLFTYLHWWIPALACPVLLSFFTYGSISHDLVHRNLFPQVPHHRWPEPARRLDPHFHRLGLKAIKLWF